MQILRLSCCRLRNFATGKMGSVLRRYQLYLARGKPGPCCAHGGLTCSAGLVGCSVRPGPSGEVPEAHGRGMFELTSKLRGKLRILSISDADLRAAVIIAALGSAKASFVSSSTFARRGTPETWGNGEKLAHNGRTRTSIYRSAGPVAGLPDNANPDVRESASLAI